MATASKAKSIIFNRSSLRMVHVCLIFSLALSLTGVGDRRAQAAGPGASPDSLKESTEAETVQAELSRDTLRLSSAFTQPDFTQTASSANIDWAALSDSMMETLQRPEAAMLSLNACQPDENGNLEVYDNCALASGIYTYNSVSVHSGGLISVTDSVTASVTIIASTITVEAGGKISADGTGYDSGSGDGAGENGGSRSGGGAGYGGIGGAGGANEKIGVESRQGGKSYGSVFQPVDVGSGGGAKNGAPGGSGGGAVHIVVTNTLIISGQLSANGMAGVAPYWGRGSGGGSGGSLWIEANEIAGNGAIIAIGGSGPGLVEPVKGDFRGGGGAGGRIAIYGNVDGFSGNVQAYGGWSGYEKDGQAGGAGTIYWGGTDRLVIDNNGNYLPCE